MYGIVVSPAHFGFLAWSLPAKSLGIQSPKSRVAVVSAGQAPSSETVPLERSRRRALRTA